jgi:putative acetyltransferase
VLALVFRPLPLDTPLARTLIGELDRELMGRYPEAGANHFRLDPDEVAPGRGAFLAVFEADTAVGCGALRLLDPTTAELKRMYVRPPVRGRRIGAALLAVLEAEARRLGARRLVLETGSRQPEALALYTRAGFTPIPPFGEYLASTLSRCLARSLVP